MKKTPEQIEQEKYELRIISRDIQREESVEALKRKHLVSGTLEEQKAIVSEKSEALEVELEEHANTIRDTQQSEEGQS